MILNEILRAVEGIERVRGHRPEVLRCGRGVVIELLQATPSMLFARPSPFLGMRIQEDKWLPLRVWRLTDADATLLFDCRMIHV